MDYPIQSANQLSAHVRSIRKLRGITQMQLGALVGVGQARIARIERDPTSVSVEQFLQLLGALGAQMVLRSVDEAFAPATQAKTTRAASTKRSLPDDAW
jgi:HTH-type transcriptional regulator/antitoxin HipB